MEKFIEFLKSPKTWISVLIVTAAVVLVLVFNVFQKKITAKDKENRKAILQRKFFNSLVKYILFITVAVVVLEINGVNVSSLITGLGIITAIVGFALQDFLKDVIQGLNLFWDKYFKLGDVIEYEGQEWEVTEMSIKATKLTNIDTHEIYTVANRNIDKVKVVSEFQNISIPGNYDVTHEKMVSVCGKIVDALKETKEIKNAVFVGTDAFLDSQISYLVRIYSRPTDRDEARRSALGIIQDVLEKEKIAIPFNQLDVHLDK